MFTYKKGFYNAYWGFIIGDALGVPYEFKSREEMKSAPASAITGGGIHNQPAGTWSDDTSLMLCVIHNLSEKGNAEKLARKFINWYLNGEYTPHGEVFDIGNATRSGLERIIMGKKLNEDEKNSIPAAGNGALMRCIPYAFAGEYHRGVFQMVWENRITHSNALSHTCCYYYTRLIRSLAEGFDKLESCKLAAGTVRHGWRISDDDPPHHAADFTRLFSNTFPDLPESAISSSGYVLHSLEAAVWCFMNSDSYEECVIKAVNLGEDTDTIAALSGALAAVYHKGFPQPWKEKIAKAGWLDDRFEEWVQSMNNS